MTSSRLPGFGFGLAGFLQDDRCPTLVGIGKFIVMDRVYSYKLTTYWKPWVGRQAHTIAADRLAYGILRPFRWIAVVGSKHAAWRCTCNPTFNAAFPAFFLFDKIELL